MSRAPLHFPYMVFAKTRSFRSAYTLSQSGMPPPDPYPLALGSAADLEHPGAEVLPALERRLARHLDVAPERVLVTVGASAAMFLVALHWFRPGSRVAAEIPSYEPVRALPARFGAELALLERRLDEDWALSPERARAALAGAPGPGHVFVTNPNNPTGVLSDAATVRALAAEAERAGGVLVCCEVYMEYVPREHRVRAHELAPNAVAIGSLTKAYGLGPLRIGWIVLGEGLVAERAALCDEINLAYVDPPTPALRLGLAAMDRLDELRRPLERSEREAKPHLARLLASEGVEGLLPEFGVIAFPRIADVEDTARLAEFLASEHDVDVVPGEYFGRPGHLRVGCGVPAAVAQEGCARLARGIAAFRA